MLPQASTWERKDVIVPNGTEAVKEQSGDGAPTIGNIKRGDTKAQPKLCLIPTSLSEDMYVMTTKGYTCIQAYVELCKMFQRSANVFQPSDGEM